MKPTHMLIQDGPHPSSMEDEWVFWFDFYTEHYYGTFFTIADIEVVSGELEWTERRVMIWKEWDSEDRTIVVPRQNN